MDWRPTSNPGSGTNSPYSASSSPGTTTTPTVNNSHNTSKSPHTVDPVKAKKYSPSLIAALDRGTEENKLGKGRKKVAKACLACQKSHVTCDDKRPCARCVKKGIGNLCVEGVRKKAKYLLEERDRGGDESVSPAASTFPSISVPPPAPANRPSLSPSTSTQISQVSPIQFQPLPPQSTTSTAIANPVVRPVQNRSPDDIWLAPPLDNNDAMGMGGSVGNDKMWFSGFGDMTSSSSNNAFNGMTAATSEYAMLDSMFTMDPVFPGLDMDGLDQQLGNRVIDPQYITPSWPAGGIAPSPPRSSFGDPNSSLNQIFNGIPMPHSRAGSLDMFAFGNNNTGPGVDYTNQTSGGPAPQQPWGTWSDNPNPIASSSTAPEGFTGSLSTVTGARTGAGAGRLQDIKVEPVPLAGMTSNNSNGNANGASGNGLGGFVAPFNPTQGETKKVSSSEVYSNVVKPYDYTEGYHFLMDYLTKNFERKDTLRAVHALASYRPSLIALQMPMSEDDEIFNERAFQRTLIELEKLISYSATPTAVWRRTGEVCYANPEFCALVKKDEGAFKERTKGKEYIYHLFAGPSVITYWENFSLHAFENTTQNFFQATTLKVGKGTVDCSCCYTIRRDVFDLPSVIIGQFLPVPQEAVK